MAWADAFLSVPSQIPNVMVISERGTMGEMKVVGTGRGGALDA